MDYIISAIKKRIEDQDELELQLFKSGGRLSQKVALNLSSFLSKTKKPSYKELNILAQGIGYADILKLVNNSLKELYEDVASMKSRIGSEMQCYFSESKEVKKRILAVQLPWGEEEKEQILHLLSVLDNRCERLRKVAQMFH